MKTILHITSGDMAGASLAKSGVSGEVLVWHDILYDGPRRPGWPDEEILEARTRFLVETTAGGLTHDYVLATLHDQYAQLKTVVQPDSPYGQVVLWFDACLFDQSMLCHILSCLHLLGRKDVELLCIDTFAGIEPYNGLGQLSPEQLASCYPDRQPVTAEQFLFAEEVDRAFALQDREAFIQLAASKEAPLSWVPAAIQRWLAEEPDSVTGLGRLAQLALEAIRSGCDRPGKVFVFVAARETPPQYWGDITLWQKMNALAEQEPPLVRIQGPQARLPQWEGIADLKQFRIYPL
ncbi:MAG: DUF1835 domain-containing protein [Candidatus Electrothrix sp. GW3-4]|uniref:DUF1835 domain-containing protein n=1 Tax=Candidatus Electrothrix sp. GW3-4 TaxID=3126740 RepID=UPI0030CE9F62